MDDELSRIEAQLDAYAASMASVDTDAEILDHLAITQSSWTIASRLKVTPAMITCALPGDQFIKGWVRGVGEDHVELTIDRESAMLHAVVRLSACRSLSTLAQAEGVMSGVPRTFSAALRTLALNQAPISLMVNTGPAIRGIIHAVHSDHIDLDCSTFRLTVPSHTIAAVVVVG